MRTVALDVLPRSYRSFLWPFIMQGLAMTMIVTIFTKKASFALEEFLLWQFYIAAGAAFSHLFVFLKNREKTEIVKVVFKNGERIERRKGRRRNMSFFRKIRKVILFTGLFMTPSLIISGGIIIFL